MFEEEAKRSFNCKKVLYKWETDKCSYIDGFKDGAKSREKRIAGLEKENDRLSRKCECLTKNNESLIDILNDVESLEKENSELKESNKSYEEIIDHSSTALMKEKLKNYKQLTKAKEMIKNLIDSLFAVDGEQVRELNVVKEARKFLKES